MTSKEEYLKIESLLRGDITDGICGLGGLISLVKKEVNKKYISKKEMKELIDLQMKTLDLIEKAKDQLLIINMGKRE